MISVGMRGIDFAFAPDSIAGIAKNKAGFICRYSAGTDASNAKCTKAGEIAAAAKLGVDFIANFELAESTPTEGAASGKRHGAADHGFWNTRGLAPGAGVIVSWEPGNNKSQFGAVGNFLSAYKSALDRPIGLYAGLPALLFFRKEGLIDFTWLPMSAAASNLTGFPSNQADYARFMEKVAKDNGLNMVQNRNRWYGSGADENIITVMPEIPFSHLQASAPDPAPDPTPPAPAESYYTANDHQIVSPDGNYALQITNWGNARFMHRGKLVGRTVFK